MRKTATQVIAEVNINKPSLIKTDVGCGLITSLIDSLRQRDEQPCKELEIVMCSHFISEYDIDVLRNDKNFKAAEYVIFDEMYACDDKMRTIFDEFIKELLGKKYIIIAERNAGSIYPALKFDFATRDYQWHLDSKERVTFATDIND